jgi:O-antigen ligase/polysaccharide polymerase Wzy-like membrane protein
MNAPAAFVDRHRSLLLRVTGVWTACGVLLYVLAPLVTPGLLVLGAVAPLAWQLISKGLPRAKPTAVTVALALTAAYLSVNASWSLSPSAAHLAVYMLIVSVVVSHFVSGGLQDCDADALRALVAGLYAGMAVGGAFILSEILSHQWMLRHLISAIPSLRPNSKSMVVQGELVVFLEPYLLNRSITALTFLSWPTMLVIVLLASTRRQLGWMLVGFVPVVAAIFTARHATSKIAFVGASIAFVGFQVWPAATRRAITLGWIAIIVLVVPVALLAYQSELYLSSWLPQSARHRIVIWGYSSQQIATAPILGAGIATTRALNELQRYDAPFAPGSDFQLTTEWHTHNVYLQTWYEAGAVGAVLLLVIGLLVLRSFARAPAQTQPYLHATFVTCALIGASSFSLWQPWFMASFALVAGPAMAGWSLAAHVTAPGQKRGGAT